MNPVSLPHLLHKTAALTGCILLATFGASRADDDGEQGGDISGSEHADQRVVLQPGPSAPTGVSGKAELEAEDEDGTTSATLSLEPKGLPDGTYTVSVTSKSDPTAAPVVLGSFEVSSASGAGTGDGAEAESGDNAQGDENEGDHHAGNGGESDQEEVKFGDEGTPFPDGFNPLDIGTISIADAAGTVDLTGDFTAVSADQAVHASVSVTPGPAAVNAKGHAIFTARAKRGKVRSLFLLGARNVPVSSTFTVNVNDAPVATVQSNRRGQVSVRAPKGLPGGQNPFQIHSVTLVDGAGSHVVEVNF